MWIETLIFYIFATLTIIAAVMVIISRDPVRSALFLVMTFITTSVIWLLLQAEFLALALIFVYVGAVMTLFLFVVMMLNIQTEPTERKFVSFLPTSLFAAFVLVLSVVYTIEPFHLPHILLTTFDKAIQNKAELDGMVSNTQLLGKDLYTHYMLPFEMAGVLLLIAMIAAISLALPIVRKRRMQRPEDQVRVQAKDRIKIIKGMHSIRE